MAKAEGSKIIMTATAFLLLPDNKYINASAASDNNYYYVLLCAFLTCILKRKKKNKTKIKVKVIYIYKLPLIDKIN